MRTLLVKMSKVTIKEKITIKMVSNWSNLRNHLLKIRYSNKQKQNHLIKAKFSKIKKMIPNPYQI